ncbi:MAG: LytR family transcriptional regulator, partial [Pseudanabaena sp.]
MAGRSLKQIFSREEYFLPVATNPINLRQKTGLARKPKSKKNFLSHKWTLFLVLFVALISGGLGAG